MREEGYDNNFQIPKSCCKKEQVNLFSLWCTEQTIIVPNHRTGDLGERSGRLLGKSFKEVVEKSDFLIKICRFHGKLWKSFTESLREG